QAHDALPSDPFPGTPISGLAQPNFSERQPIRRLAFPGKTTDRRITLQSHISLVGLASLYCHLHFSVRDSGEGTAGKPVSVSAPRKPAVACARGLHAH